MLLKAAVGVLWCFGCCCGVEWWYVVVPLVLRVAEGVSSVVSLLCCS